MLSVENRFTLERYQKKYGSNNRAVFLHELKYTEGCIGRQQDDSLLSFQLSFDKGGDCKDQHYKYRYGQVHR